MTDAPPTENAQPADGPPGAPQGTWAPLRRSRDHKVISGVCGGLGRCFDLDPVIFRVILGVLAATGGLGLIVYGFAWLLIPLEGEEENEGRRLLSGRIEGPALTAVLCALVGCGLFLSMLNNSGAMAFSLMLSFALIGSSYWSRHRRVTEADEAAPAAVYGAPKAQKTQKPDAPPETLAPPPPGAPSWWRDPVAKDGAHSSAGADAGYLWGPDDGPYDAQAAVPERVRRVREGRPLGGLTTLLAAVACWIGIELSWGGRPLGTTLEIGLACAVGVYGIGLAVSSWYGRVGGGTVVLAVLTAVLLTGAAALPKSVTAEWTRSTWRPTSAAAVQPEYRIGSGVGLLDLTGLPWNKRGEPKNNEPKSGEPKNVGPKDGGPTAPTVSTRAEAGAGQLKVVIPEDITAELTVEVGLGYIQLPGTGRGDVDIKPAQRKHLTLSPPAGHASRGTLELRLKTGIGQVEVTRATP